MNINLRPVVRDSVMLGAMQQNGLPKLFFGSDFVRDSVSMLLEKIPPSRDHEGDFPVSLAALNG
jgi:hypothetical protein